MGMYTECVLNVRFNENLPDQFINTLKWLAGSGGLREDLEPHAIPDHELFKCDRYTMILTGSSAYFLPSHLPILQRDIDYGAYYLSTRFNIKNYEGEIEKFIDWIMPHIDEYDGGFLGYTRYEDEDEPTLIYKKGASDEYS